MINRLKKFYYYLGQANYLNKIDNSKKFEDNRLEATVVRLTHAIEKGLCISKPRLGYGKDKIKVIINNINVLKSHNSEYGKNVTFFMAYDALNEYVDWHNKMAYSDETVEMVREWLKDNREYDRLDEKFGGTVRFERKQVDLQSVQNLFDNRHSSRAFIDKEIDRDDLKQAIQLANRYPSACNRQAVRLYVVNHKRRDCVEHWFNGKPGFWDDVKDFIMVCGKVSAYVPDEYQQYEVSAGIYIGYLTLALQAYGIGSCVIQREVISTKDGRAFASSLGIPEDEQLVCLLACGYQDETFKVPFSHRFSVDEMTKFVE